MYVIKITKIKSRDLFYLVMSKPLNHLDNYNNNILKIENPLFQEVDF